MKIEPKLPDVGTTIFTVMSGLANEYNAINLSQGFPDFKIDPGLKNFVVEALDKDQVQYAPMPGRMDLREAISAKIHQQHGISVDPHTEITITAGATQAIYCSIAAVIRPGDEVILFDPAYDCYDPAVRLHGGKTVHLKLTYPNYGIDWDELDTTVNDKTRMLILNNPHNPSGSIWSEDDLLQLERLMEKYPKLILISDEVYEHIQFTGQHQSVLKSELLRQRSFVTYSFGKTFHVTGWKIGYCVAPPNFTRELRSNFQFNVFCVNNTMQYALAKYMENSLSWQSIASFYQTKKYLFRNAMGPSRFRPLNCDGTYFCLYDFSEISNASDTEFAKRLTIEHGVAAIPVSVFYGDRTDNKVVRFCFAKEDVTLLNAAERLCRI